MSTPEIIHKLARELDAGIETEPQVVYLLAGTRKLIERDGAEANYPDLRFHCDWALHASMNRAAAMAILKKFDDAYPLLSAGAQLDELPRPLAQEIDRISKMTSFEKELSQFLSDYELPQLTAARRDGWAHFLHLYAQVIADIPLMVSAPGGEDAPKNLSYVTVKFELARETLKFQEVEEVLYKVSWLIYDKAGKSGEIFVLNSFSERQPTGIRRAAEPTSA